MRKYILIIISAVILIMLPSPTFASIPTKNGHVQDIAKLFSQRNLDELKTVTQSNESDISFYILTIESFNGKKSGEYGKEIFKTWGLNGNDTLLLLSKQDKQIEVYFSNKSLLADVNLPVDYDNDGNSNESVLEELLGKHFLTYAKDEHFAAGLIDFMNTFRSVAASKLKNNDPDTSQGSIISSDEKREFVNSIQKRLLTMSLVIMAIVVLSVLGYVGYNILPLIFDRNNRETPIIQEQRPSTASSQISVADALENIINSNVARTNSSASDQTPAMTISDPNDSSSSLISTDGFRIIRESEDNQKPNDETLIDVPEPKRVIR